MKSSCMKLSPIISADGDDFNTYINKLYELYLKKIANSELSFHGKPIRVFTELNYNLQQQTFEHLTTKGNHDRLYNKKRCERICWISEILSNMCNSCEDYRVFCDIQWKNKKNNKRYVVWCVKEDYVIILEERQKVVMLITAYCLIYSNKRRELEIKYKNSEKTKTPT